MFFKPGRAFIMLINHLINMSLNPKGINKLKYQIDIPRVSIKEASSILEVSIWKVRNLISRGMLTDCIKSNENSIGPATIMISKDQILHIKSLERSTWLGEKKVKETSHK